MARNKRQMWVHKDFRAFARKKAAELDMSLIDVTRKISNGEKLQSVDKKKKHEKFFQQFKI